MLRRASARPGLSLLLPLLCLPLAGLSGCIAASYRIGAGPTVDSMGRPGGEVFVGVSLGGATEQGMAFGLQVEGSAGGTGGERGGATLSYGQGLYFAYHERRALGVRLDVGMQALYIEGELDMVIAPYLNAALLYPLHYREYDYLSLGIQLHASVPYQEQADDTREHYGRFRAGLVFEHHLIVHDGDFDLW